MRTARKPAPKKAPIIPTKGTPAWIAWQVQAGARCLSWRKNAATAWRHELTTKGDEDGPAQTIKLTATALQHATRAGAIRGVLTETGELAWNQIVYEPTSRTTAYLDAQP